MIEVNANFDLASLMRVYPVTCIYALFIRLLQKDLVMKLVTFYLVVVLTLGSFFTPAIFAQEAKSSVTVNLTGKGEPVAYSLEVKQPDKNDPFEGAILKAGSKSIPLGTEFSGFFSELKAYSISGDSPVKILVASAMAESDYMTWFLFGIVDGELKKIGSFDGQGSIKMPGNGTMIITRWMGFWAKTEKFVFGKNLELTVLPQEFYGVDVEGTVTATFPVYQKRDGKTVLANTLKGSKFKVLLWDPASCKADSEGSQDQWYLIQTASGFVGWVQEKQLGAENVELPWAG